MVDMVGRGMSGSEEKSLKDEECNSFFDAS